MAFPIHLPDIHAIAVSVQHQPWFNTDPNPHKSTRRQHSSHPDHDDEFYTLQSNRSTLSLRSLGRARLRRKVSAWSMRSAREGTERRGTQDTEMSSRVRVERTESEASEASGGSRESGRVSKRLRLREQGGRLWRTISRG